MLENEIIQYRGFRNTYDENGNCTGFQFRMRSHYYRGLWLSQLRIGRIIIDGEVIMPDSGRIVWNLRGVDHTPQEMFHDNHTHWTLHEPVTIKVSKPGGLSQGYHDLTVRWGFISSYMPPETDVLDEENGLMGAYKPNEFSRRMLIV